MARFIQTLALSHFRSHHRSRLQLDGRPVALFGANGAGKTNILEAVSLLSPGRGLRRASGDDLARMPERIGWKVTAEIVTLSDLRAIESWAEPAQGRQVRIDGKLAPQIALADIIGMVWLTPAMDRLWIEGAEGRRRFLDRLVLSFLPDHAVQVMTYEKAMRERNRLLRDQVNDSGWYAAVERQMAQSGAALSVNRRSVIARLAEFADVDSPFPVPDLALDCTAPEAPDDLMSMLAQNRPRDRLAGRSLAGPHRADLRAIWAAKGMEAAKCSTGEQKALLISLVLANARALASGQGAPPILLLDEVAAHLDADRRRTLYDVLADLGAQAFLTGTGAELFAEFGARAQQFRITEAQGLSSVQEVTP